MLRLNGSMPFWMLCVAIVLMVSQTGCGRTTTFDGPAPDGAETSSLAIRSETPAEIYEVSIDWVQLKNFHSQFEILPGTHTIAAKFETRQTNCGKSPRENCNGRYYYGDCVGAFVSAAGRNYTAVGSAGGKSAEINVIDAETHEKVGDASCAIKGSSYSAAVR